MADTQVYATPEEQAQVSKDRGAAASRIQDPEERRKFIAEQGEKETADKKNIGKLNVIDKQKLEEGAALAGYKKGTDRVPKTGPAILHKDEAVLNKSDAEKLREAKSKSGAKGVFDNLADELGGGAPKKSKKELSHIVTKKAKSGGYIHEHHFTHPEDHAMEQHVTPDQDAMADHMIEHMGAPNPGEADADAGQSGIEGE